jgi:hypothetical protein
LACAAALPHAYSTQHADYRGFARYVIAKARPGDLLVFMNTNSSEIWEIGVRYMALAHYRAIDAGAYGPPCDVAFLTRPPSAQLVEQIRHHPGRALLVYTWSAEMPQALPGAKRIEGEFFPLVATVDVVEFPPPGATTAP